MTSRDLSFLPPDVTERARIDANGEVSWPMDDAERAINVLADTGRIVLGTDVRRFERDGIVETPWSAWRRGLEPLEPRNRAEAARRAALEALPGASAHGDWLLVTWQEP